MSSSIKDNRNYGRVADFLTTSIKPDSNLSFVSAYFTIYAFQKLQAELEQIEHLRFLFGEPSFLKAIDPEKHNRRDFEIEDDALVIPIQNKLVQKQAAKDCAEWIKEKVSIRSISKSGLLHGKCYQVTDPHGVKEAMVGSSNFTVNGLGLGTNPNIELNIEIQDKRDIEDLSTWFDELWNDKLGLVEDVKDEVLAYLEKLYADNEPEFIYYKTLFHIFEDYLDEQREGGLLTEKAGFFESEVWSMLYEFQKDGVRGAINKILRHNGCIIADSVGLGKTFEALAIIHYFELLNYRVLVLCPKKLSDNWTIYQASQNNILNPFKKDRFNYSILYHTDMGRKTGISAANGIDLEKLNWGAYDLVVIDESHNFRGNPTEKKDDDGNTRLNRAKWLMDKVIKSGIKTKVLMLSATPVNTNLRDLRNQFNLITEEKNDALLESSQIKDIAQTLKTAQTQFTQWAERKTQVNRSVRSLLDRLDSSFFKLLDELTIARSRRHLKNFYKSSEIGEFPERLEPISIYPSIDIQSRFPSYDKLNKDIQEYKLTVFNPSAYVRLEKQAKYEKIAKSGILAFKQKDRESFLIGMMKINYLKRLESSIESFEISIRRTIEKIENLQERINQYLDAHSAEVDKSIEAIEPDDEEIEDMEEDFSEDWQVGKKLKFDFDDLRLEAWLKDLTADKDALVSIYNNASAVTPDRDAKLADLKDLIAKKLSQPINGENRKVIVFTAFVDTADYLYKNIQKWVKDNLKANVAMVAGNKTYTTFGKNDFSHILANFSPVSKKRSQMPSMPQDEEIDVLIATDCISEGQNLQDCDYLVNYDIHWNPVRIIQRFGRIDRLGSKNDCIQMVNFWPTKDLDNYINLKARVEARMALVDVTATGEDNLLEDQIRDLIEEDLKYRNKQLKRLQKEVLDLEDMTETVSLTEFTFDDFRIELMNFLQNNRKLLEEAPFGLYAVVPSPGGDYSQLSDVNLFNKTEREILKPGVVFCLQQKGDTSGNEEVNPLQPYFLVYIRNDGTVRFNYTNAKQILEIYRSLCQGRSQPIAELCELFDSETNNGEDMDKYSDLLNKAVSAISQIFRQRSNQKLVSDRGALIVPKEKQIKEADDFDLVTWLVIK